MYRPSSYAGTPPAGGTSTTTTTTVVRQQSSGVLAPAPAARSAPAAPVPTGQAVPFIQYIEEGPQKGQFVVTAEAKAVLDTINERVAVVSVAGIYRTGKSYILNQLAGSQQKGKGGFKVGNTVQACTKGLWLWGDPIRIKASDGKPITVLLLDTEGIASLERSEEANVQIFSLGLLMASYFIYNSMINIDESAIDRLGMVAEVTKRIRHHAGHTRQDPREFAQFFPSFMWLLRDFALDLRDSAGRPITPQQYLEEAFQNRPAAPGETRQLERNNIRDTLRTVFPERDCYTLVRPTQAEAELQNMANMPLERLRPEFLQQLQGLQKRVFDKLKPKMIDGNELNGPMLFGMAQAYVTAINQGAVPTIMSAWEGVATLACHEALEEAREFYTANLKQFADAVSNATASPDDFENVHKRLLEQALDIFRKKAVGSKAKSFEEKLLKEIQSQYEQMKKFLEKFTGDNCARILDALWYQFSNTEFKSHDAFTNAVRDLFIEYNKRAPRSLAKLDVLMKFLSGNFAEVLSKTMEAQDSAAKGAVAKNKKLKDDLAAYQQQAERDLEALRREVEQQRQRADRAEQGSSEVTGRIRALENELQQRDAALRQFETQNRSERQLVLEDKARLEDQLRELQSILQQTDSDIVQILNEARAVRSRIQAGK